MDTLDAQRLQKIRELETVEVKQEVEKEVVHEKPVFLTPLNNLDLKEGEHAHLECRVEPINDPNLKIEWYLNQFNFITPRNVYYNSNIDPWTELEFLC